jgi:glycosyltransferase involved in cell wall biosynthesis
MSNAARERLDIVIPVYNEGANIVPTLRAIAHEVKTPSRILICYDYEGDDTLPAIDANRDAFNALNIEFVRNRGSGAHGAVLTGFSASDAPFVLVYPADDDYNAGMLDAMVAQKLRKAATSSAPAVSWLAAAWSIAPSSRHSLCAPAISRFTTSRGCRRTTPATAFGFSPAAPWRKSQSSQTEASATASNCW